MSKPLFKEVSYSLSKLMDDVEMGEIGLPDIQRPFVWKNNKVRDLFDSMYQGYPVGYLLFWETDAEKGVKQIGTYNHQKVPHLLIVDGQQRLTSLFAILKEKSVIRENYDSEKIEIAFKPLEGKFEVADAGIRRSPEWISNISECFRKDASQYAIVGDYLKKLKKIREDDGKDFNSEEQKKCELAFQKLFGIGSFPFTVLQLSAGIDEEQVAEVFVRINSKGKSLNQADFILTLMSVFWEDGRKELEAFCKSSRKPEKGKPGPYNYFIEPDPDQLLRVSVGIGFRRARLQYAYALLRGKDLESGKLSKEQREKQFEVLQKAQKKTLNLQNWHDFLSIIQKGGFRSSSMINSKGTLIYTYILYIIGKEDYNVSDKELQNAISRWFFMAIITSRYISSSPESAMERDLADFRGFTKSEEFLNWINNTIKSELTSDFWETTLPARMETSSPISPYNNCYIAALHLLDARALFSEIRIWDALDPTTKAKKSKVERHHLFPKNYLKSFGLTETRTTNQIANFALVEWKDNLRISDAPPSEYLPEFKKIISQEKIEKMNYWHALPRDWENMTYDGFLYERRKLMAIVTRDGFKKLEKGEVVDEKPSTIEQMVVQGEGVYTEFKSTLRVNLHTGERDKRMEHAVLKTISGFLNSKEGGHLVIGMSDDGTALGLNNDGFDNEDKMDLHLGNLIKTQLGAPSMLHIKPKFHDFNDERIFIVDCKPSKVPIYLKNGNDEEFYIRAGGSSAKLTPSQMTDYIKQRFN
tara:strand:+ start:674 stop:2941 length:2268 start_codon:yes stop_codon:yes gene_type:complete